MKRVKLQDMTVTQLVDRFSAIGIEQDQAILKDRHGKFNRLFDQLMAVQHELKAREGGQRHALLSLYNHPNAQTERHKGNSGGSAERFRRSLIRVSFHRRATRECRYGISNRVSSSPSDKTSKLFMDRNKLRDMTVDQLVERFTAIALDQDRALLRNEYAKFNRLFERMEEVKGELRARSGDERRALLRLYDHPNAQVRLKAVKATLAVAPERARRMLEIMAESGEYPQAGDAGMTIDALDRGIFRPT